MGEAEEMLARAGSRTDELAAGELTSRPRRRVAVLACMDTRIDLYSLLGLERGDAHIIRNAGGLVTDDALRSLSASQRLLGTERVIVVMHEGCGLLGASDEEFAAALAADGAEPAWSLGGFADLDEALRSGLERLRSAPELPARQRIHGFVFDPDSGNLRDVEAERRRPG
jgi:carbonic anhydrase